MLQVQGKVAFQQLPKLLYGNVQLWNGSTHRPICVRLTTSTRFSWPCVLRPFCTDIDVLLMTRNIKFYGL